MTVEVEAMEMQPAPRIGWGWYLLSGLAWFVIGLLILSWSPTTITLIAATVGAVVIMAGVMELALAFAADGWRWLHGIAGVVFVVAGVAAFFKPAQTFVGLAVLFGWYLLIKGAVVITMSLADRRPGSLWGLGALVGAFNLILGLWAIGYPDRSAWLLVLWVGIGTILHGVGDIVHAFEVRAAR